MTLSTSKIASLCAALSVALLMLLASAMGVRTWNVPTGSMEPAIPAGSAVLTVPGDLETGVPYVYRDEASARFVAHRLVRVTDRGELVFKGDAISAPDRPLDSQDDVQGRIVAMLPGAGSLVPVAGNAAWALCAGVIALSCLTPHLTRTTTEHRE